MSKINFYNMRNTFPYSTEENFKSNLDSISLF